MKVPAIVTLQASGVSASSVILFAVSVIIAVWLFVRAVKRSEDPPRLIFKWILTLIVIGFIAFKVMPMGAQGGEPAFAAAFIGAICGLVFTVLWRESLAAMLAKPFMSLYDGGDAQYEARPVYSIAQAKLKRGSYTEAVAEIRKQLQKFPNDFEGQLLLAQVQAENMNDLSGAELTIQRLLNQAGHSPRGIALALNCLADWHLKFAQDREAARQDLQSIIDRLPDTEMSAIAAQRIGHLASNDHLLAAHDRKRIVMKAGVEDIGLLSAGLHPKAPEADPAALIDQYVSHLQSHPLDTEVREMLAILYADHHGRLDLAIDQIEQLIGHPNQPPKRVTHWLNLLADLQLRHGQDYETIRGTLERIIDLFPDSAAAQIARNRVDTLKLELKGKEKSQTIRLGSYEQDIGLKRQLPGDEL